MSRLAFLFCFCSCFQHTKSTFVIPNLCEHINFLWMFESQHAHQNDNFSDFSVQYDNVWRFCPCSTSHFANLNVPKIASVNSVYLKLINSKHFSNGVKEISITFTQFNCIACFCTQRSALQSVCNGKSNQMTISRMFVCVSNEHECNLSLLMVI